MYKQIHVMFMQSINKKIKILSLIYISILNVKKIGKSFKIGSYSPMANALPVLK